ncbi:MAG: cell wall-binding repeat-containing protein, partial [Lachnospiraceae bacterium]|nr:cell wall-binding repeat-containing protein [Lachnospiraceae bacterium]
AALSDEAKAIAEERSKFYIIGGEGAVSADIAAELGAYGEVVRVSGKSRYETSVAVANTFFADVEAAVVASGKNFPDGLCGGPLAAAMNAPLILTADGKTDAAADYVAAEAIASGFVLGGAGALADDTVVEVFALESADEIK